MTRRIVLDNNSCAGNGRCYGLAPELMTDDERGYGVVVGNGTIGEGQEEDAQRIVRACPEQAISISEA
jgi:ferredoxin